jgi:hypothetical protein
MGRDWGVFNSTYNKHTPVHMFTRLHDNQISIGRHMCLPRIHVLVCDGGFAPPYYVQFLSFVVLLLFSWGGGQNNVNVILEAIDRSIINLSVTW